MVKGETPDGQVREKAKARLELAGTGEKSQAGRQSTETDNGRRTDTAKKEKEQKRKASQVSHGPAGTRRREKANQPSY